MSSHRGQNHGNKRDRTAGRINTKPPDAKFVWRGMRPGFQERALLVYNGFVHQTTGIIDSPAEPQPQNQHKVNRRASDLERELRPTFVGITMSTPSEQTPAPTLVPVGSEVSDLNQETRDKYSKG